MRYYFIRHDKNDRCDDVECGGQTEVQFNDQGKEGWTKIISIQPFTNPDSAIEFRKKCIKCGKEFPVKLTPHDTKDAQP